MRTSLIVLWIVVAGCPLPGTGSKDAGPAFKEGTFPAGFLWGTATAGFQVEAGCPTLPATECEDRQSDWYQFVMSPEARLETGNHLAGQDVSVAPGFWELYDADLDRVRNELGANAFRMGVEWSRIFPASVRGVRDHDALRAAASATALAHYRDILVAAKAKGLKTLVTLNHYSLPLWIHDGMSCHADIDTCTARGWLDTETIDELATFSGFVAKEYGDVVDLWATQNEPLAVVLAGYLFPSETRTNPPAVSFKFAQARTVVGNMQIAHARQYDAVKANDTVDADGDGVPAKVGLVYNIAPTFPRNPESPSDQAAAEDANYLYNRAFLDATIKGDFDAALDGNPVHRDDMAGRMDFLGINYYTRVVLEGTSDGLPSFPQFSSRTTFNPLRIEQGADYARGIYDACMIGKSYGIPLIITENGADDSADNGRGSQFLVEHLVWLARAIRDGADVRGYFWWTLTDNYEWNHGMDIRMGLYAVNKDDAQKTRHARRTVATFKRVADGNAVPSELVSQYPVP